MLHIKDILGEVTEEEECQEFLKKQCGEEERSSLGLELLSQVLEGAGELIPRMEMFLIEIFQNSCS